MPYHAELGGDAEKVNGKSVLQKTMKLDFKDPKVQARLREGMEKKRQERKEKEKEEQEKEKERIKDVKEARIKEYGSERAYLQHLRKKQKEKDDYVREEREHSEGVAPVPESEKVKGHEEMVAKSIKAIHKHYFPDSD